ILGHLLEVAAVGLGADISQMGGEHRVFEGAQRMVGRQRLAVVDIECGPREVLTRVALGFIRPSSRAPMVPRLRALKTRCSVTTSLCARSASFSTRVAPHSAARAGVRLLLQAITFMPKAVPTLATPSPILPSP